MVKQEKKQAYRLFLNPVTLLTSFIFLIGLVLITLVVLFLGRNPAPTSDSMVNITLVAAPTLTPTQPEPTATPSPTATQIFVLPEGVIGVGTYVQVTGTAGAGLRMRGEPGLDGAVNFTALDAEVFLVIGGPEQADGYTWWHLEAPYDPSRNGWSAGDFLTRIDEEID